MFEAIGTGKNTYYGAKGEVIMIADNHLINALKEGWITSNFKYLGESKFYRGQGIKEKKVAVMPEKKIYLLNELKMQTRALERIIEELKFVEKKGIEIKEMLKEAKDGSN